MGKIAGLFAGLVLVFAFLLLVGRLYPLGIFIFLILCGPLAYIVAIYVKNGVITGLFSRFYLLLLILIATGLSAFYLEFAFDFGKKVPLLSSFSSVSCITCGAILLLAFSIKRKDVRK